MHRKNILLYSLLLTTACTAAQAALVEPVLKRFYHIQRLEQAIELLKQMPHVPHLNVSYIDGGFLLNQSIELKNSCIITCIEQINLTHSLEPLFKCWNELLHYKQVNQIGYLREFLLLVIIVYKTFFVQYEREHPEQKMKISLQEIAQLYKQLNDLPVEELLNAIDTFTDELAKLLQEHSSTIDSAWIKQKILDYWWTAAAALIAGTVIYEAWKK